MQQEIHLYFEDGTSLSYVLNIINPMKKYRQPFYKTYIMVFLGTIIITSAILFPIIIEHFNKALSNGVEIDYLIKISILFFVSYLIFILFITVYNCFYVVVSNSGIDIINGIIPFIRKKYLYRDIIKVEIGNKGGFSQNYIRVIKSNKTKSLPLVICLVSKEDCMSILNDIKSYGIDIEITGHLK